jgi:hypothetical protein
MGSGSRERIYGTDFASPAGMAHSSDSVYFIGSGPWPELLQDQKAAATRETLHRYLQIVGKVRLAKSPWQNHSWQTTFYLTGRGLTTSLIHDHGRSFTIDFDFVAHEVQVIDVRGQRAVTPLRPKSVAEFYRNVCESLAALDIELKIDSRPSELPDRLDFSQDEQHRSYDPLYARRFWQVLVKTHQVLQVFESTFSGKISPIHFFWGGMDLAATRFSGRRAPPHPGGIPNLPDLVTREAYSHEVSSCGFWPGDARYPYPAFYSYAYPEPNGFSSAKTAPKEAFYHDKLREFILPYEVVRKAKSPENLLFDFFQSTYLAAANLGGWDRKLLEESEYLTLLHTQQRKAAA